MRRPNRTPDVVIGPPDNPYMERWHLIPRNPWFNIYLHKISRSDDARALHDHRADNLSILLEGRYTEIMATKAVGPGIYDCKNKETFLRKPGHIVFRKAERPHRLVLDAPVWTLWIKWRDRRDWGFWVDDEWWIQHEEYGKAFPEEGHF